MITPTPEELAAVIVTDIGGNRWDRTEFLEFVTENGEPCWDTLAWLTLRLQALESK